MPTGRAITAVDLFSGAGGLSLGLAEAGFSFVQAAELWAPAIKTYRCAFPNHPLLAADLGEIDQSTFLSATRLGPGDVDLVAGGPPCQGFSVQRIGSDRDERNHLVLRFGELVNWLRPKMFLMENVPGLLGKRGRVLASAFSEFIQSHGYDVTSCVIDAADYGVPQRRRRVIICGWLRNQMQPFAIPEGTLNGNEHVAVRDAIGDLPLPPDDYSPQAEDPLHRRMRLSHLNQTRLALIPPGGGFENLPVELRADCHKNGSSRVGHRNVYGRLHPDRPAATITARFDSFTRGQFAHPSQDRNISLREGARLQTFPDSHPFFGTQEEIAALIGNAVPPKLAQALGAALHRHLSGDASSEAAGVQLPLAVDLIDGVASSDRAYA